jgi:hypothetical protein
MNWTIEPVSQGKIAFRMIVLLLGVILFCTMGCSTRFFIYKDTLTTELVTSEELPHYNKVTVCQGPAILYLSSETLNCIVRCYDSNNDAQMLSLKHRGIDVFEYNLPETRKHNDGQFYRSFAKVPYTIIIDINYDGIGDFIFMFEIATAEGYLLYEKIKIGNHHLVMDDFAPASFRLSDFKSYYDADHPIR